MLLVFLHRRQAGRIEKGMGASQGGVLSRRSKRRERGKGLVEKMVEFSGQLTDVQSDAFRVLVVQDFDGAET